MNAAILCYHKVGPKAVEGRSLNVEPETLSAHVQFFRRKNFRFFLPREISKPYSKNTICFTFDDAYLSTLEHAPEILERYSARGCFYAVSGKVGAYSDWDGDMARPLANLESLRKAEAAGHEIGNHSKTHRRLAELSREEQKKELRECRDFLLALGLVTETVCYPFGSYNHETTSIVEELGYRAAMTLKKGPLDKVSDLRELPRITIAYSDRLPMLLYKLTLKPMIRKVGR